jgi:hypothetical protein
VVVIVVVLVVIVIMMIYSFFWVIPWRLYFMKMEQSVPKHRHIKFKRLGITPQERMQHSENSESLKSRIMIITSCYVAWKHDDNVIAMSSYRAFHNVLRDYKHL